MAKRAKPLQGLRIAVSALLPSTTAELRSNTKLLDLHLFTVTRVTAWAVQKKSPAHITERGSRADLEVGETNLQAKHILAQMKIERCDGYHISYSHQESVNNSTWPKRAGRP